MRHPGWTQRPVRAKKAQEHKQHCEHYGPPGPERSDNESARQGHEEEIRHSRNRYRWHDVRPECYCEQTHAPYQDRHDHTCQQTSGDASGVSS